MLIFYQARLAPGPSIRISQDAAWKIHQVWGFGFTETTASVNLSQLRH
jgi:hypothetical protein